jgi:hypothetical protein
MRPPVVKIPLAKSEIRAIYVRHEPETGFASIRMPAKQTLPAVSCQEANDPDERIFSCFPLFGVLALSASGVVA